MSHLFYVTISGPSVDTIARLTVNQVGCALKLYKYVLMLLINLFISNFKVNWIFSVFLMIFGLVILSSSLLLGVVPNILVFSSSLVFIFRLSLSMWFIRYIGGYKFIFRFYNNFSLLVIGIYLFDVFVVILRPVTLTLRVIINVSLGHYLIMIVHLDYMYVIILVWAIEIFVYLVQFYVFLTLIKSYIRLIVSPLSLRN